MPTDTKPAGVLPIVASIMKNPCLKTGAIGWVITAICCFTPALVWIFGAIGLATMVAYLDVVLFPLLGGFTLMLGMAYIEIRHTEIKGPAF